MTEVAELLRAIAALLWPIVGGAVILLFRKDVRSLVARIKKGKLAGVELELDRQLDQLQVDVEAASAQVPAIPASTAGRVAAPHQLPAAPSSEPHTSSAPAAVSVALRSSNGPLSEVGFLSLASTRPKVALMMLSAELEREVRDLVASVGLLPKRPDLTIREGVRLLEGWSGLPAHLLSSLEVFGKVRNQVVHGHDVDDKDALRALDIGLTLLRTVQAIPHERHRVLCISDAFADARGEKKREGTRAVVLESTSPGGLEKITRAFPTQRTDYKPGQRVGWAWRSETVWPESWYRDCQTGEVRYGWTGSMEFDGPPLGPA